MEEHEVDCSSKSKKSWLDCGEDNCRRHTNRVDQKYCRKCLEILNKETK